MVRRVVLLLLLIGAVSALVLRLAGQARINSVVAFRDCIETTGELTPDGKSVTIELGQLGTCGDFSRQQ